MKYIKKCLKQLKDFSYTRLGMLICACWGALIFCLIVKLLNLYDFTLSTDNKNFIAFCNYVEDRTALKMLVACLLYLCSTILLVTIMIKRKLTFIEYTVYVPLMVTKSLLSWYYPITAFILDAVILIGITTAVNKNFKRNIISVIVIMLFQIISIVFRCIGMSSISINNDVPFVQQLLLQIDYYLMLLLYFLYTFNKRKEV